MKGVLFGMNKKELLDQKIKVLMSVDIQNDDYKELFNDVKKNNPELVDERLTKIIDDGSSNDINISQRRGK